MTKYLKVLGIVIASITFTQQVLADGALALDSNQGLKYGWAVNQKSDSDAMARALKECGDKCKIVFSFSGGAAAYAADQTAGSSIYGWGRAADANTAKKIAVEEATKRGAKNPVVRVWGQETPNQSKADEKMRVFVGLKIALKQADPMKPGGWVKFTGWTTATRQELTQYGKKHFDSVLYSDNVTGAAKPGTFLATPGSDGRSYEQSPIMQRFFRSFVARHPKYAERNSDPQYYGNEVQVKYTDKNGNPYMAYDGYLYVMDNGMSYENFRDSYNYWENHNPGYTLIDAQEFN